eukprot:Tbor_TRINITY_DN5648_c1_g9::TRINITY_DN5648_c1_g9_i1::g.8699::m.8699/K01495/GCH1, folE; GTP cyclohydrolase IA
MSESSAEVVDAFKTIILSAGKIVDTHGSSGFDGEDINRPGLQKTPLRAAKAFQFLTQGYQQSVEGVVGGALFPTTNTDLVLIKGIEFFSLCEHHLLPFFGVAHVGYIPNKQVIGLSKVARVVDLFARRLQIQENLTQQVASALLDVIGAKGVAVVMDAEHSCMRMRGVMKQNSTTRSCTMLGVFSSDCELRREFLLQISS